MDTLNSQCDAEIRFHFKGHDFIEVCEVQKSGTRKTQRLPRTADVVAEVEKRYVFPANEADHARKMIAGGHSCVFYVALRER
jgi:hypothetical protein